jgi:hypothetical protein
MILIGRKLEAFGGRRIINWYTSTFKQALTSPEDTIGTILIS